MSEPNRITSCHCLFLMRADDLSTYLRKPSPKNSIPEGGLGCSSPQVQQETSAALTYTSKKEPAAQCKHPAMPTPLPATPLYPLQLLHSHAGLHQGHWTSTQLLTTTEETHCITIPKVLTHPSSIYTGRSKLSSHWIQDALSH
jgi:hypothetical protein